MSISSWKREFYRTPAKKCSKRYALRHSLKKWTGLLRRNLRKHDLNLNGVRDIENKDGETVFCIDVSTCALCTHYYNESDCKSCPLETSGSGCLDANSSYNKFMNQGRVSPMINLLTKTIKNEETVFRR